MMQIQWLLDRATRPLQLKVEEALHIQNTPANNSLNNRDWGYELPGCWIATMKKLGDGVNSSRTSTDHMTSAPIPGCMRMQAQEPCL